MAWVYLMIAGLFEICWAIGLKYTEGFSKFWPSVGTVGGMILSFLFLAQAVRTIPLGTGYAIWTGIGVAGTAILGMIFFAEGRDWPRIMCLMLILIGMVGLKIFTK